MAKGDKKPVVMTGDIDSTVAKKLHAAQHKAGGVDPITAADVGARPDTWMPTAADVGAAIGTSVIASGVDLNTVTTSGMYRISGGHNNCPEGVSYGQLLVIHGGADTITQMACAYQNGTIWTRSGNPSDVGGTGSWSAWRVIATTDYALPRDGSAAMTGDLILKKTENGYGRIMKNHSDTADYGTTISDFSKSGKEISISLEAANNNFLYNADGVANHILHTGNKPSGSYTGNGAATGRDIQTGGIGNVVLVWSNNGFAVITPVGALKKTGSTASGLYGDAVMFRNGVLTIASDDVTLNANGVTYTYQVL